MLTEKDIINYYITRFTGTVSDDDIQDLHNYLLKTEFGKEISQDTSQEMWEMYIRIINRGYGNVVRNRYRRFDLYKIEEKLDLHGFIREETLLDRKYNDLHLEELSVSMWEGITGKIEFERVYQTYKKLLNRSYFIMVYGLIGGIPLKKYTLTEVSRIIGYGLNTRYKDEKFILLDDWLKINRLENHKKTIDYIRIKGNIDLKKMDNKEEEDAIEKGLAYYKDILKYSYR